MIIVQYADSQIMQLDSEHTTNSYYKQEIYQVINAIV